MDTIQAIKQRFEIIGNEPKLNRDRKNHSSCPTDISVLVVGESGVGRKYSKNHTFSFS
jgi:transcriptional regulator with PAS, ATPase and Fis domain